MQKVDLFLGLAIRPTLNHEIEDAVDQIIAFLKELEDYEKQFFSKI
jgi:hypothetical protein